MGLSKCLIIVLIILVLWTLGTNKCEGMTSPRRRRRRLHTINPTISEAIAEKINLF